MDLLKVRSTGRSFPWKSRASSPLRGLTFPQVGILRQVCPSGSGGISHTDLREPTAPITCARAAIGSARAIQATAGECSQLARSGVQ